MVSEFGNVYLGKIENYHFDSKLKSKAYYDNSDRSLQFISANDKMFNFLTTTEFIASQDELLNYGITMEDYEEWDCLRNGILKDYKMEHELLFNGKPFNLPGTTKKVDEDYSI